MPFRRCRACAVGRAVDPIAYWEIGPTTQRKIRRALRARHISPLLARRNTENGSGLGRWRWVIERTFAWLNQFRRLRLRYEKRADMHKAFLSLACALICWKFLQGHFP
jgi:transposase